MEKLLNGTKDWLKRPFREDGSAIDWFLFVGLMIAISFIWSRILARIN
jgi:hypothetical protein